MQETFVTARTTVSVSSHEERAAGVRQLPSNLHNRSATIAEHHRARSRIIWRSDDVVEVGDVVNRAQGRRFRRTAHRKHRVRSRASALPQRPPSASRCIGCPCTGAGQTRTHSSCWTLNSGERRRGSAPSGAGPVGGRKHLQYSDSEPQRHKPQRRWDGEPQWLQLHRDGGHSALQDVRWHLRRMPFRLGLPQSSGLTL